MKRINMNKLNELQTAQVEALYKKYGRLKSLVQR